MESWDSNAKYHASELGEFSEGMGFSFDSLSSSLQKSLEASATNLVEQSSQKLLQSAQGELDKILGIKQPVQNPPQGQVVYYQAPPQPQPVQQPSPSGSSANALGLPTPALWAIGGVLGLVAIGVVVSMVRGGRQPQVVRAVA